MAPRSHAARCREQALLLAAARAFVHDQPLDLRGLEARPLAWERLLERAEQERLAPLLFALSGPLPVPAWVQDRLSVAWVNARRQYLLGARQLAEVLSALEARGVPVIPLKGPALGEALYREPALRPFTDLDLLIRPADRSRALEILSERGYRHLDAGHSLDHELGFRHAATFVHGAGRAEGFPLDVHWAFLDYPGVRSVGAIDPVEVWDRAVRVEWWGRPAWTLAPEDLLIYLAVHWAVHHACAGLLWSLDLALLLRRFGETLDWEAVSERARRWSVRGALSVALRACEGRFGVAVPPAVWGRLWARGLRGAAARWLVLRSGASLERLDYLLPFLLMDGTTDLFRALARGLVPPAAWVRSRYGKGSALGSYLAHYARIGKVCLRTVRAAFPLTVPLPLTPPSPPWGERIQGEGGEDSR